MSPGAGRHLWVLLALLQRQRCAEAKVQTRSLQLKSEGSSWHYLAKFGYDRGLGSYTLKARAKGLSDGNLTLEIFLDEDWHKVETTAGSCERTKLAKRTKTVKVGKEGNWGPIVQGTVKQSVRPHIWYFAISTCNQRFLPQSKNLAFQFEARQEGGSHFSYEQLWMPTANLAVLAGFSAFAFVFVRACLSLARSAGKLPAVVGVLGSVLLLQYAAQTMHTAHLFLYRGDGSGVPVLELLSELLFVLGQILQTLLLVAIAMGYTLLRGGVEGSMVPVCCAVALAHAVLVCAGKLKDEASQRFHDYEGGVGWALMALRLGLFVWFLLAARWTSSQGGFRLQHFLQRFVLAGSLYFLAYPALFLAVDLFAPYLRAPVMASGQMAMQLASQGWLSWIFFRRGDYYEVSSMSTSVLPGGSPTSARFKDD